MFGVLQRRIGQRGSQGWCPFGRDGLCGVEAQRVEGGDRPVVVLYKELGRSHWSVVLGLENVKQSRGCTFILGKGEWVYGLNVSEQHLVKTLVSSI